MSGEVLDTQFNQLVIANDANEETIYSVSLPANSITTATRYQMVISGVMSTPCLF